MNQEYNLVSILNEKNINASLPRIEILDYLYTSMSHPNIDEIYSVLSSKMTSLSKATVYNTLELFAKKGLVNNLYIENNEVRYDVRTERHGHFKCIKCGRIYDFEVYDVETELKEDNEDFKILSEEVNYRGICKDCK